MSFWKGHMTFPWSDPRAQQLCKLLVHAYSSRDRVSAWAASSGLDLSTVNLEGSPNARIHNILNAGMGQLRVDTLIETFLNDRSVSHFASQARPLLASSSAAPMAPSYGSHSSSVRITSTVTTRKSSSPARKSPSDPAIWSGMMTSQILRVWLALPSKKKVEQDDVDLVFSIISDKGHFPVFPEHATGPVKDAAERDPDAYDEYATLYARETGLKSCHCLIRLPGNDRVSGRDQTLAEKENLPVLFLKSKGEREDWEEKVREFLDKTLRRYR